MVIIYYNYNIGYDPYTCSCDSQCVVLPNYGACTCLKMERCFNWGAQRGLGGHTLSRICTSGCTSCASYLFVGVFEPHQ